MIIFEVVAGVVVAGAFAWAAYETRSSRSGTNKKLDSIDVLLRGDGNGNPGIAWRVREVHLDVKSLRRDFDTHAASERDRVRAVIKEEVEFIEVVE